MKAIMIAVLLALAGVSLAHACNETCRTNCNEDHTYCRTSCD